MFRGRRCGPCCRVNAQQYVVQDAEVLASNWPIVASWSLARHCQLAAREAYRCSGSLWDALMAAGTLLVEPGLSPIESWSTFPARELQFYPQESAGCAV